MMGGQCGETSRMTDASTMATIRGVVEIVMAAATVTVR
jgi:hypothetical protein